MSRGPEHLSPKDDDIHAITFGSERIDLADPHWLENAKHLIQGASFYIRNEVNAQDIAASLLASGVTLDDIHTMQNIMTKTLRKKLDGTQPTLELLTSISAAMQTDPFDRPPESYLRSAGAYKSSPHIRRPGHRHTPEGFNPEDR